MADKALKWAARILVSMQNRLSNKPSRTFGSKEKKPSYSTLECLKLHIPGLRGLKGVPNVLIHTRGTDESSKDILVGSWVDNYKQGEKYPKRGSDQLDYKLPYL